MRLFIALLACTALSACGGAGVESVGGAAVSGNAVGGNVPSSGHTFVAPTEIKTYQGIGGQQSYQYKTTDRFDDPAVPGVQGTSTQYNQLYAGNASTARDSGISLTYNPRDAIFELTLKDEKAIADQALRFQDPLHRTAFGGAQGPQEGTPDFTNQGVLYLEAINTSGQAVYDPSISTTFPVGSDDARIDRTTFFYQKPGTTTKYVTFAGFVRNKMDVVPASLPDLSTADPDDTLSFNEFAFKLERAAFVYGERTLNANVPKTGSGTFTGPMIATAIYNPLTDIDTGAPTYFQWMSGSATTNVNFATNLFDVTMTGTVRSPGFDLFTSQVFTLQNGASFNAAGKGRIDLINAGGFLGAFDSAYFTQPGGQRLDLTIAGSSIDGAFFGPAGNEVGGGFRIVGGVPDERIDIMGAFVGKQ
jgi:hypothetical protein